MKTLVLYGSPAKSNHKKNFLILHSMKSAGKFKSWMPIAITPYILNYAQKILQGITSLTHLIRAKE